MQRLKVFFLIKNISTPFLIWFYFTSTNDLCGIFDVFEVFKYLSQHVFSSQQNKIRNSISKSGAKADVASYTFGKHNYLGRNFPKLRTRYRRTRPCIFDWLGTCIIHTHFTLLIFRTQLSPVLRKHHLTPLPSPLPTYTHYTQIRT